MGIAIGQLFGRANWGESLLRGHQVVAEKLRIDCSGMECNRCEAKRVLNHDYKKQDVPDDVGTVACLRMSATGSSLTNSRALQSEKAVGVFN